MFPKKRTDTWGNGGVVVFNYTSDTSHRWDHPAFGGDPNGRITINNFTFPNSGPSDGIALSPDFETIYFCSVSSSALFRVPALQLFDFSLKSENLNVEFVGYKGYSDGMTFDKVSFSVFMIQNICFFFVFNFTF